MSLLFWDGFSHYATADVIKKWTTQNAAIINVGSGRRGGNSLRSTGGTAHYVSKTIPATTNFVIGFAYMTSLISAGTGPKVVELFDSATTQCDLRVNGDGTLSVTRNGTVLTGGTSSFAISAGAYYFIEWKVTIADSIAANSCKVRVNGVDWITVAAGQDTKNTANATANVVNFGTMNSFSGVPATDFADFYLCDQSGTTNNDFLGDIRVDTLYPNADGTYSQWNYSGLSGAHRYWRVNIAENNTSTTVAIGELILRTVSGGANVATGGTASASTTFSGQLSSLAFDANNSTYWNGTSSFNGTTGLLTGAEEWLKYDLGPGNDKAIIEFAITCAGNIFQAPRAFKLQYSDDGVNWANLIAVTNQSGWALGQTRSFTYSAPAATHYNNVDESIPDAYDYNYALTPGLRDSYAFQDLPSLVSPVVYGVQINAAMLKDDAGNKQVAPFVRSGGTDSDGPDKALGTTQAYVSQIWETNPSGAVPWTQATVNAAEFGVKVSV